MSDYPSKRQLKAIKEFDLLERPVHELIDCIEEIWHNSDWGFKREKHTLELHTGGWSGNEDTISALQRNFMFWSLYWGKSERGGHYYFDDSSVTGELKGFIKEGM